MKSHSITLLGTGLIGMFYTMTLHGHRRRDRITTVYSRTRERAEAFAAQWGIARATNDLKAAIEDPETDTVIIGLPNDLHVQAVEMAAAAGKAVLCTKPLGRTAAEARRMLEAVEKAGVFAGYLEDLVYTPKTLKALESVRAGALGDVLWVRSRETHPDRIAPGSGMLRWRAAARLSTWGATAPRLFAISPGRTIVRWK